MQFAIIRAGYGISTHALREEGDIVKILKSIVKVLFLPTPSARRATDSRAGRPAAV